MYFFYNCSDILNLFVHISVMVTRERVGAPECEVCAKCVSGHKEDARRGEGRGGST